MESCTNGARHRFNSRVTIGRGCASRDLDIPECLDECLREVQLTTVAVIGLHPGKGRKKEWIGFIGRIRIDSSSAALQPVLGRVDSLTGPDDADSNLPSTGIILSSPRSIHRQSKLGIRAWVPLTHEDGGLTDVPGSEVRRLAQQRFQLSISLGTDASGGRSLASDRLAILWGLGPRFG
ncbi:MAG: hypothetical protein KC766_06465 [Myxococcales bacterium]|nr:hypothetical protein [Myxococcales bacterium]